MEAVAGHCQGHPRYPGAAGHRAADCFKISRYLDHFLGNLEGLKCRGPTICFTFNNYSAPFKAFLSYSYTFKKPWLLDLTENFITVIRSK